MRWDGLVCALALGVMVAIVAMVAPSAEAARVKDLAFVDGMRDNQLIGYGLVVGLDGTGDNQRTPFTRQSLSAMLSRSGVRIAPEDLQLRNVAAVMVTASLAPSVQPGTRIDVAVSSIGNARSLEGGTLLMTALKGVDDQVYAVAQGALQVSNQSTRRRIPGVRPAEPHRNRGRVPGGALVERAVPASLVSEGVLRLHLRSPDFTTATQLAATIDGAIGAGASVTTVESASTVAVQVPTNRQNDLPKLIAEIEVLTIQSDQRARVVINGRTGTVVLGEHVEIRPMAVTQAGMTVQVREARGPDTTDPETGRRIPAPRVPVTREKTDLSEVPAATTLADVVRALNALGASPRDLIEILQAMAAAGGLEAELVIL